MANMFQVVSNLGDITYITKLSMEIFTWNINLLKLMSFTSYLIVVLIVVEPEKMKKFNVIATVVFCLIGKSSKEKIMLIGNSFNFLHRLD